MRKPNYNKRKGSKENKPEPFAKFRKEKSPSKPKGVSRKKKEYSERKKQSAPSHFKKREAPKERAVSKKRDYKGTNELYPLNKYLAHCGVCARRKAVEHIKAGEVKVNNKVVKEPGVKVSATDQVSFNNKLISLQQKLEYFLLNKPKDCLTTTQDPRGRRTVMDYMGRATTERVYPVGRLDRNTSGLLLITNDGNLAQQLSHPSGEIEKVYHVTLNKPVTKHDFETIAKGLTLEDGDIKVDALAYVETDNQTQLGLEIHSGRNRIVRRIFEHLGYEVKSLDRVIYAGLTKKNLPRGKWRRLSDREVRILKHFRKNKGSKNN